MRSKYVPEEGLFSSLISDEISLSLSASTSDCDELLPYSVELDRRGDSSQGF